MQSSDIQKLYRRVFSGEGQKVLEDLEIRYGLDASQVDDQTNRAFRAIGNDEVLQFIRSMINE